MLGVPPPATKLTDLKILRNLKMEISKNLIRRLATPTPLDCGDDGYWCVICQRLLPNDDGVIVHDALPHPDEMTFDEEDRPQ